MTTEQQVIHDLPSHDAGSPEHSNLHDFPHLHHEKFISELILRGVYFGVLGGRCRVRSAAIPHGHRLPLAHNHAMSIVDEEPRNTTRIHSTAQLNARTLMKREFSMLAYAEDASTTSSMTQSLRREPELRQNRPNGNFTSCESPRGS
ncbi:hypothetical protein, partial [Kocuria salina]|uniref:hypothetical protein n=1 Tax=Kocuria salina TaxID=1929416 RepID=UPI0015942D9F